MHSNLPSPTINECISFYLDFCETKGQSLKTIYVKSLNLNSFMAWCSTNDLHKILDINFDVLEGYQSFLNQCPNKHGGGLLQRSTIRAKLTAVKIFIKLLYNKGVISDDPFETFELPKLGRRLPKPVFSEQEVERVLNQTDLSSIKGIRDRAIMETYYASGIRRFELAKLLVDDIDFEQYQLTVNLGKGYKDRYIPISSRSCYWIYRYLKQVRPRLANKYSGNILFLANTGKSFRLTQLSEMVSKYIKLANVRKSGACNQYRHAAATHMVNRGADIRYVQAFLGHADISTTQIYVHVSMTKLRDVYNNTHPSALPDS